MQLSPGFVKLAQSKVNDDSDAKPAAGSPPKKPPGGPPKRPRSGGGKDDEDDDKSGDDKSGDDKSGDDKSGDDNENKIDISKKSQPPIVASSSAGASSNQSGLSAELAKLNADLEQCKNPVCERLSSVVRQMIAAVDSGLFNEAVAIFNRNFDKIPDLRGMEVNNLPVSVQGKFTEVYWAADKLKDFLSEEIKS